MCKTAFVWIWCNKLLKANVTKNGALWNAKSLKSARWRMIGRLFDSTHLICWNEAVKIRVCVWTEPDLVLKPFQLKKGGIFMFDSSKMEKRKKKTTRISSFGFLQYVCDCDCHPWTLWVLVFGIFFILFIFILFWVCTSKVLATWTSMSPLAPPTGTDLLGNLFSDSKEFGYIHVFTSLF